MNCPYPGCASMLMGHAPDECDCVEKNPLARCGGCAAVCRAGAAFCRQCGTALKVSSGAPSRASAEADFLFLPGSFHRRPIECGGFMWALSTQGVYRLSPRRDAKARLIAAIPSPAAAFSGHAVVTVRASDSPVAGPALVAADPSGVYAVSLIDGRIHSLYVGRSDADADVNTTVQESPYFRGVCAESDTFAFVQRRRSGDRSLAVGAFTRGRALELPVAFRFDQYVGPVIRGRLIGLCTPSDLWVYDSATQSAQSFQLPRTFEPYVQRPRGGLSVPPGHVPLAVQEQDAGVLGWVAGEDRGRPGVLEVHLDRGRFHFHEAARGSVTTTATGALCLATASGVEMLGGDRPAGRITALEPGLPVSVGEAWLVCFGTRGQQPRHAVNVFGGKAPITVSFDDADCDENSCCGGAVVDGRHLLVGYLRSPRSADEMRGLRFARWDLQ